MKSNVKGVYWTGKLWMSRTVGKRTLYRGPIKAEAEAARLKYNAERKNARHALFYSPKEKYKCVFQPEWRRSGVAGNELNPGFWER